MRQDKLTTRFQELLAQAQSMAAENSQQYIDPLHVLLAVLHDDEGTGRTLLERSGVRVQQLEHKVREARFRRCPERRTIFRSAES